MSNMSYAVDQQQPTSLSMPGGPTNAFHANENPFAAASFGQGDYSNRGIPQENEKIPPGAQQQPYPGSGGQPPNGMAMPAPQTGSVNYQPAPTNGMSLIPGNRNALNKPFDHNGERQWSHSLCSCIEEPKTCCCACWCPCIVYGWNKQRADYLNEQQRPHPEGESMVNMPCGAHWLLDCCGGWGWVLQTFSRGEVRTRYRIRGNGLSDCCTAFWCMGCDLVQEYREIELEEQSYRHSYV